MPYFRTKPVHPVEVQAVQFFPDQRPWPEGVLNGPHGLCGCVLLGAPPTLHIHTLPRQRRIEVAPGDWIVTYIAGDRDVVPDATFKATYDPIPDPPVLDPNRCAICAWPLAATTDKGCVRGNCALRPPPAHLYDPARAKAEDELGSAARLAPVGATTP
jgi:hypothetical protein